MNSPRILLIQLKRAGDVMVCTPAIEALHRHQPFAQIDFLVDKPFAPLLRHNPALRKVLVFDRAKARDTWRQVRREAYDVIVDFQSSPRSAMVCLTSGVTMTAGYRVPFWGLSYRRTVPRPGAGVSVVEGKFTILDRVFGPIARERERRIYLTPEDHRWASSVSPKDSVHPIGIIPTHRHAIRRWPAESFVAVAREWRQAGRDVWWFWGSPEEEVAVQTLAAQVPGSWVIPATSFRQMAALLARCRLVVTNDNGPMHLATAVGTPTVTIYGPTDPSNWNPGGSRHRALTAEGLRCLGCNMSACPFDHDCMKRVLPQHVLVAVRDVERGLPL